MKGLKSLLINYIARNQMQKNEMEKWIYNQMMYVYGVETPFEYLKTLKKYKCTKHVSQNVTQDVLILAGAEDHIIPLRMYKRQFKALTNANSVTGRVFTKKERASNHCQVGNIGLALHYIVDWINSKL
jgi:hypothetical protein